MIFHFNLALFKEKQEKFRRFDSSTFPYSFYEFWKWKIKVETKKVIFFMITMEKKHFVDYVKHLKMVMASAFFRQGPREKDRI